MSKQLINCFLLIHLIITGFGEGLDLDYKYTDPEEFNGQEDIFQVLLRNFLAKSREDRASDNDENWTGRWLPGRISDPTPPPKILHKSNPETDSLNSKDHENWTGRWFPERPSDPTPPPKILHKSNPETDNLDSKGNENWTGRWFPESPLDPKPPPKIPHKTDLQNHLDDHSPGMNVMGIESDCDDGKTNLAIDWNGSRVNYTCYGQKIEPDYEIEPELRCEKVPDEFLASHICMDHAIEYDDYLPLYGHHRPLWGVYGEYKFIPRQRWLHNLEHGAVVLLYHPCANHLELQILKNIVTSCIKRHIISPSNFLTYERPFALLTWGCQLSMSWVDPEIVQDYIIKYALQGPEKLSVDGSFDEGLIQKAKTVSDDDDTILCPKQYKF